MTAATRPEVATTSTVYYDLMGYGLTVEDICDAIVEWIGASQGAKTTVIHSIPARRGQPAFEMSPRIDDRLFYVKVVIDGDAGAERMTLLSAHLPRR